MRIIDFHAHVFPDNIAQRATDNVCRYYNITSNGDGSVSLLLATMDECGVSRAIVHSTATCPAQIVSINNFIAGQNGNRLIGFGTVHPGYEDIAGEIARIKQLGLCGVKLHPDFQEFAIDAPEAYPIYEHAQAAKLPVLVHLGDQKSDRSHPKRLAAVLEIFPRLTVIGAHLGGYSKWDDAEKYLVGKNLYFDTSSALRFMSAQQAKRIIRAHGIHKILFGTDYPLGSVRDEIDNIAGLEFTGAEMDMILYENALKLLDLS